MKSLLQSCLVVCFAISALACSSSKNDAPSASCETIEDKSCELLSSCLPFYLAREYGDLATCKQRLPLVCGSIVSAAGSGLHGDALQSCGNAFASATCDDYLTGFPACEIKGTLANGTACGTDLQCASGSCVLSSATCGVCADIPAAGAPCVERCTDGYLCVLGDAGKTCLPLSKSGSACDQKTKFCDAGLSCVGSVCVARAKASEPCATDGSAPDCDDVSGTYCGSGKTCQPYLFAAVGEPCGLVGLDNKYCRGGWCKTAMTGDPAGTCAAFVADGQPCSAPYSCAFPALCGADGVCRVPDPAGCK